MRLVLVELRLFEAGFDLDSYLDIRQRSGTASTTVQSGEGRIKTARRA